MKCDHYLGMLQNYENTDLVTFNDLQEHIEMQEEIANTGSFILHEPLWRMQQYTDLRYSTDLVRFTFCPKCGEKLDWKKMHAESQATKKDPVE